ncbi:DUF2252 domain-containing protein [Terrabacter aeriphilus]|uniref:DUF2252 domain-containing protein n=1 Tax=Terrabacter aeriphilus TaxID=515662 RepID=A0ABP9JHK8_9MICO
MGVPPGLPGLGEHARLVVPPGQDPVAILQEQGSSRIEELLPVRYGRMLASPFAFYRGAAAIMAADLGAGPRTGLDVQLCGDAHISNFGLFASAERRHLFDLNDFDETWPGPFEWDVKRFAASLHVAARGNDVGRRRRRAIVVQAVDAYRRSMADFAGRSTLEVWYAHVELQPGLPQLKKALPKPARSSARKVVTASRGRDSTRAARKLTVTVDGQPRFRSDPPLLVPIRELAPDRVAALGEWLDRLLDQYRESLQSDRRVLLDRFRLVDVARKAVGVGSVGTRAWLLLLLDEGGEPLVLQAKEAVRSVLADHAPAVGPGNEGQRVVEGQRLMQASSDLLLGWQRTAGDDGVTRDYYVRQFHDWKGGYDVESLDADNLELLARIAAWTLARAHARSGDRRALAAYLGDTLEFAEAVADFAEAYADKNERDHAALAAAAAEGRVPVA